LELQQTLSEASRAQYAAGRLDPRIKSRSRLKVSDMDPFAPLFYMALALAAVAVPYAFYLKYQIDRDDREASANGRHHPAE
jgi:hypothetical protein